MQRAPFQFIIKPLPLALLIYLVGWFDFKTHLLSNRTTIGYFLMTIGVWIMLSRLVHIRNKRSEYNRLHYHYRTTQRTLAAWGLIGLPSYTLFHWWWYRG